MTMSNSLQYLQLQPVEPTDDNTTSPLDDYTHDETIDLTNDPDGATLTASWDTILNEIESEPPTQPRHKRK